MEVLSFTPVSMVAPAAAMLGMAFVASQAMPSEELQKLEGGKGVLTPVERLSEILFGLIMTLSLTGTLSVVAVGREDVVTMMIGILGCNLAWGAIDGVLYVLSSLSERGRNLRLYQFIRTATKPEDANRVISGALPPAVALILTPQEIDGVRQRLVELPDPPRRAGVTADDVKGALGVCVLVFSSCLPLIVPFIFIKEPLVALRISNVIALVSLFLAGYFLARYAGFRKVWTGIAMVILGVVLVGITIQLGG
jgi:hypothetical protein